MDSLIKGIEVFQHQVFPEYEDLFRHLATGQSPEVLMITCSDSRIDPSLVTQTKPGELFLIRNVGNIVPPCGSGGGEEATVEYAVRVLGVRNIVVCGHTDCGAMKAVLKPETLSKLPAVNQWLSSTGAARRALEQLPPAADDGAKLQAVTERNILVQIDNLKTHPAVQDGLSSGDIHLLGTVYAIDSGEFFLHCPGRSRFVPLSEVTTAELR